MIESNKDVMEIIHTKLHGTDERSNLMKMLRVTLHEIDYA